MSKLICDILPVNLGSADERQLQNDVRKVYENRNVVVISPVFSYVVGDSDTLLVIFRAQVFGIDGNTISVLIKRTALSSTLSSLAGYQQRNVHPETGDYEYEYPFGVYRKDAMLGSLVAFDPDKSERATSINEVVNALKVSSNSTKINTRSLYKKDFPKNPESFLSTTLERANHNKHYLLVSPKWAKVLSMKSILEGGRCEIIATMNSFGMGLHLRSGRRRLKNSMFAFFGKNRILYTIRDVSVGPYKLETIVK